MGWAATLHRRDILLGGVALLAGRRAHAAAAFDHEHAAWTSLLRAYVNEGNVAYGELSSDEKALKSYLSTLHAVDAATYRGFSRAQQVAYWVNAYNAHAVALVLENLPLESVRSIGLIPGSAMRKAFIPIRVAGDDALSLQDISTRILPGFADARAHLACAPAAAGGPMLRSSAYRADALNSQLEDAAYRFLDNPDRVKVDVSAKSLTLPEVLEWHRAQIEAEAGSLPGFVSRYAPAEAAYALKGRGWKVAFRPLNWSLNGH